MFGLMQDHDLLIASIIEHAARHHAETEIVSRLTSGEIHRTNYRDIERRSRKLASALLALDVKPHERVATLAWNSYRHLEGYYAISGIGAVCHTINPRLSPDDIAFIMDDAEDTLLFADDSFVGLVQTVLPRLRRPPRAVIMLTDEAPPAIDRPAGVELLAYGPLVEGATPIEAWPRFDERTASSLCYTSGTTGRPKGVLYSHRSTILHAMAVNAADAIGLTASDRVMPVVPMFHVNAWGIPYSAPMAGAALLLPGRFLDGASVAYLLHNERATLSAGVPTIWLGLLQHLRASGECLPTVKRLIVGGSSCPLALMDAFEEEYGIHIDHAWGMTETSPIGTFNRPKRKNDATRRGKQGRALYGIDLKLLDDDGREQPWDGEASGHLMVRGPWVRATYFGAGAGEPEAWFATGDVATIDADGFMEITDRSKDVIKSGGEWISSIQLENIAIAHPDVAEAAIIGAHHPKWDERPLLVVVAREGAALDTDELLSFYKDKVPNWWLPDEAVVVEGLPHTATGKIDKRRLRDQFAEHRLRSATAPGAVS